MSLCLNTDRLRGSLPSSDLWLIWWRVNKYASFSFHLLHFSAPSFLCQRTRTGSNRVNVKFITVHSAVVSKLFLLPWSVLYLVMFVVNQIFNWVSKFVCYTEIQLKQWYLFYNKWSFIHGGVLRGFQNQLKRGKPYVLEIYTWNELRT